MDFNLGVVFQFFSIFIDYPHVYAVVYLYIFLVILIYFIWFGFFV